MPFNVIRHAKGLVEQLKHVLLLSVLESMVELIAHRHQHNTLNGGTIIELLLVSILDHPSHIRS